MHLLDRLLALLAKRQMSQQYRRIKTQRIHVLARRGIHLARARQHRALRLGLGRRNDVGNPHQLQQPLALLVVLPRDPHRAARKLLDVLGRAGFFRLLEPLVGLLLARVPLGELARLELGRGAVKDV